MNRRGDIGDQVMIFSFLFLLFIVGIGIVVGVTVFFGPEYDFRQADSDLLNYKVKKCLIENDFEIKDNSEFFSKCELDEKVLEENKYIVKICKNSDDCVGEKKTENLVFDPIGESFVVGCVLKGAKDNQGYGWCTNSTVLDENDRYFILTGANQRIGKLNG